MFNDMVIIETIYTSGNDIYLPLLIDLLISNNFSSKYDIFLCSRVFKIVGVVFFKIVGVGFSKLSESGFQNCRSRVFKISDVKKTFFFRSCFLCKINKCFFLKKTFFYRFFSFFEIWHKYQYTS